MLLRKTSTSGGFFARIIIEFLVSGLAFWAADYIVPGLHTGGWKTILIVALIIGAINVLVNPVLSRLFAAIKDPMIGILTLAANTAILYLLEAYEGEAGISLAIDNPWSAILGALIISLIGFVFNKALE
ncbi:MAG: phage holin family protein [Dehalococcoidia bacterium]